MCAAAGAADQISELPDEICRELQAVETVCSQLCIFANSVIWQAQTAASGVRDQAILREIEIDLDIMDAVFHRAFTGVSSASIRNGMFLYRQILVAPEDTPIPRFRPEYLGPESAAHLSVFEEFSTFVSICVA